MSLEPLDSEYTYREVKEALLKGDIDNILNRFNFLVNVQGIPEEEAKRTIRNEFGSDLEQLMGLTISNMNIPDWQPPTDVGAGSLPDLTLKIPDTGYPPIPPMPVLSITSPFDNDGFDHKNPDGYAGGRDVENLDQYKTTEPEISITKSQANPYQNQNAYNYVDAPFNPPSNPSMHGEHGFNVQKSIPEWKYDVEDDQGGVSEAERSNEKLLAPMLDEQRKIYLQKQSSGKIEQPHEVTGNPEDSDDPVVIVIEEPHEATEAPLDPIDEPDADEPIQEVEEPMWAKYHYVQPHERGDVCNKFHMKVFNLIDMNRPVPPSEGLGYTTTHPNCQCWWEPIQKPSKTNVATKPQMKEFGKIKRHITRKANKGELHTVGIDGALSKRTRKSNPLRETIEEIRGQFSWLTDDYLNRIKTVGAPGRMFLIRASNEAITDHRSEGEPYRRWLSPDELHSMARTAIGKGMDVNHNPELQSNAQVLDSEYDIDSKQIQMIVNEQDTDILNAIERGLITAVSINGGAPRSEKIQCPECQSSRNCECFIVPEGVVLGEADGIALTWVVTDPKGMIYHGQYIQPATPGVKTTAIEPL